MEIQVVNLLQDKEEVLSFDEGIYWLVTSDDSTWDNITKLQVFLNDSDLQSKVYLIVLESSEDIKSKAQSSNQLTYLLSSSAKTQLKIESVPWFTCVKNQDFLYSSLEFPTNLDFLKQNEDELTELKSPEKVQKDLLSSVSPELPSVSQLISKDIDQELDRAHQKIGKLRLRVSQQEQTIEDYKVEINMLKAQLSGKNVSKTNEKESKINEKGPKINERRSKINEKESNINEKEAEKTQNIFRRNDLSGSSKIMKKNKFLSQVDDREFWKIDENEQFQESLRLDDKSVAKDLWLMGLIKNSPIDSKDFNNFNNIERASEKSGHVAQPKDIKYSKNLKPPAMLPPIQTDKRKNSRSLQRDISELQRNPRFSSKNPTLSKSRLVKS